MIFFTCVHSDTISTCKKVLSFWYEISTRYDECNILAKIGNIIKARKGTIAAVKVRLICIKFASHQQLWSSAFLMIWNGTAPLLYVVNKL